MNSPKTRKTLYSTTSRVLLLIVVVSGLSIVAYASREIFLYRQSIIQLNARARLQHLSFALRSYHDAFERLPDLVSKAAHDRPVHSWRVEVSRFAESPSVWPYDESLPWNSPANLNAAQLVGNWFQTDQATHQSTTFAQILAIDNPEGVWHGYHDSSARKLPCLALIPESRIGLLEPKDLSLDELSRLASEPRNPDSPIYVVTLEGAVSELNATVEKRPGPNK